MNSDQLRSVRGARIVPSALVPLEEPEERIASEVPIELPLPMLTGSVEPVPVLLDPVVPVRLVPVEPLPNALEG
jgi:hypothetical protein